MKKIVIFLLFVLVSSCSTQTLVLNNKASSIPHYASSQLLVFWGIAQQRTIDAANVCGGADKVAKVQTKVDVLGAALAVLTIGTLTFGTAEVYCTE